MQFAMPGLRCVSQFSVFELRYSSVHKSFTTQHECLDPPCGCGFVRVRGRCLGAVECFPFLRLCLFCILFFSFFVVPFPCVPFFFSFSVLSFCRCGRAPKKVVRKWFVDGPTTPKCSKVLGKHESSWSRPRNLLHCYFSKVLTHLGKKGSWTEPTTLDQWGRKGSWTGPRPKVVRSSEPPRTPTSRFELLGSCLTLRGVEWTQVR